MQLFQLSCSEDSRSTLLQLLATSTPSPQQQATDTSSLAEDVLFEAFQLLAEAPDVTLLADCPLWQLQATSVVEKRTIEAESASQSVVVVVLTESEAELSQQMSQELYRVCADSGIVVLVHGCSPSTLLRGNSLLRRMNVIERQLPAREAMQLLGLCNDDAEEDALFTVFLCCKKHETPAVSEEFQAPLESRLESWANVVVPDLSHMEEKELVAATAPAARDPEESVFRVPSYARQDASIIEDQPYVEFDSESESTPAYFNWRKYFPELQLLLDNLSDLQEEALAVAEWVDWPEQHYSDGGSKNWKVVPFMYTFPAYETSKMAWVEGSCARCPKTVSLLRQLPNLRTALFSRLGPASRISAHTGWQDLANYVLRCHVSLKIPSGNACGLWVDGEVRLHRPNEILVFDDSKLHRAFNESDEDRLVLILDMVRPEGLPLGEAQGGHTAELDNLIKLFS